MNMNEFRAAKSAFTTKWGEKMVYGSAEEMAQMRKECSDIAKFARLRPEKMLWALSQDWLARNTEK